MGLRIRLVEPRSAMHNIFDRVLVPRLGLPLIGKVLAESGHDVHVYCEVLAPVQLDDLLAADLVGISSTTATAPAAYQLADLLGAAGVPVVLGGSHVSFCADEALNHAPYVVRGEGQQTMAELVACLEDGRPLEQVQGLSFRVDGGEPCHNPARRRCTQEEFEQLPIPDLSLIEDHQRLTTKPIMTQWGCPFDCEFCSVVAMFGRAVRHRRSDQVLTELQGLAAQHVFFFDDNFVVNKARTTELLRAMVSSGLTPTWSAQVRADTALRSIARPEVDHDFLALMYESGCRMVMIGIEAITDEALAQIGKRLNVATVERSIGAFHDHGIAVHGMFVAGLDTDTATSAVATADFARRLGIETFQLMVETPGPGTRLWDRVVADGRLLTDDWSLFDGHHVVMAPAQMTALELQLGVIEAMRQFYSWPTILASGLTSALSHLPDLTSAVWPALLREVPTIARLAYARRWEDTAAVLDSALPAQVRARVNTALSLPAIRLYARHQLATWWKQDSSRQHLQFLASLG